MNKLLGISFLGLGGALMAYAFLRTEKKVIMTNIDSYLDYLEKNPKQESVNCVLLRDELEKTTNDRRIISGYKTPLSPEIALKKTAVETRMRRLEAVIKTYKCGTYSDVFNCSVIKQKITDLEFKISLEKNCSTNPICQEYKNQLATFKKAYNENNCSISQDTYSPEQISECVIIDEQVKKYANLGDTKTALNLELKFANLSCRDKIEYKRQKTSADVFSKEAELAEIDVLGKSSNEEYVYIGIGGLIILSGLLIIVRK